MTDLDETINPSQSTAEERRLGLSKSDQTAKCKESTHTPTATINCSSSEEIVKEFPVISSLRKSEATQQWTERVRVAPASGLEPDDGFSWRKYGQKAILGAKYPRHYYRCAGGHRQGCSAKKLVQRSDDDPAVFEITYHGRHTCNQTSVDVVPPFRKNPFDFNADGAKQNPKSRSQDVAVNFRGDLPVITPNSNSNNDNRNLSSSMFDCSSTPGNIFSLMSNNSNFFSTALFLCPSSSETNYC